MTWPLFRGRKTGLAIGPTIAAIRRPRPRRFPFPEINSAARELSARLPTSIISRFPLPADKSRSRSMSRPTTISTPVSSCATPRGCCSPRPRPATVLAPRSPRRWLPAATGWSWPPAADTGMSVNTRLAERSRSPTMPPAEATRRSLCQASRPTRCRRSISASVIPTTRPPTPCWRSKSRRCRPAVCSRTLAWPSPPASLSVPPTFWQVACNSRQSPNPLDSTSTASPFKCRTTEARPAAAATSILRPIASPSVGNPPTRPRYRQPLALLQRLPLRRKRSRHRSRR